LSWKQTALLFDKWRAANEKAMDLTIIIGQTNREIKKEGGKEKYI
jgi:hypothetical protein